MFSVALICLDIGQDVINYCVYERINNTMTLHGCVKLSLSPEGRDDL